MQPSENLVPPAVRDWLEANFYSHVTAQATLDRASCDPAFWARPGKHVALFSDHGVVHARDIAGQVLAVLDTIHGVLIPRRSEQRLNFMREYGALLAWLHDIGMSDFSAMGRAMHPEFAAQSVFSPAFDGLIDALWREGSSVVARLQSLNDAGALRVAPQTVLREWLTVSMGHSKSKVPAALLGNRVALRKTLQTTITNDLAALYRHQRHGDALPATHGAAWENVHRFYTDFECDGFDWLVSDVPALREGCDDIIDTIRALRAADALRQRGTVLKTSAGYEIFVSQQTGNAMFAFRRADQLFLYELADALAAGEANIAGCELDRNGDLRISFHRGAFADEAAVQRAAEYAAFTLNDIQADVIGSFLHPSGEVAKRAEDMRILMEEADDNPRFAPAVLAQFGALNAVMADRVCSVPSLRQASEVERNRYLNAREVDWDAERRAALLDRMAQAGYQRSALDAARGFVHVRWTSVAAGETLIEAGAPSGFVYIPLGDGLQVIPMGGYAPFSVNGWMPLGVTGVIRGAIRNAQVRAVAPVDVLIIPAQTYWRHWHNPYDTDELRRALDSKN